MTLDTEQLNDVPVYQAWIWCTVGTLFWAIWVAFLQKMQADISAEINARNVTAADYTVWVSGLAGTNADDAILRDFAEHYGQVISAFHVRNVGTVLNLNNQVSYGLYQLCIFVAWACKPKLSCPVQVNARVWCSLRRQSFNWRKLNKF